MASGDGPIDLAQLQKTYKMVENDRARYAEESQNIIKRQRQAIEKIRKENERLKEQLESETRSRGESNSTQVHMARLMEHVEIYKRKIETEERRLEELDRQAKIMNVKILESQVHCGGKDANKIQDMKTAKQIRILENRLDHALVRFNDALAVNKLLREEIDHLRSERVVFDNINSKLAKELQDKKKEMALIIEQSNIAYEARDQANSEMALLKAQADKEQSVFEAEWRELGKILERDRQLKLSSQDRAGPDGGASPKRRGAGRGSWDASKDRAAAGKLQLDRAQSFEEAFQQIKAATGIDNIDELVQTFIDAEDQNFSLFNYVNELNNEIEKLEEQLAELRQDIDKYKGQGGHNDRQRKKLLKDLEDRLATTEAKAEQYEAKSVKAAKTVSQLEKAIEKIFETIGCNKAALSEMMGTTGVSESNMIQYLGIIEQRTNELLQALQARQLNETEPDGTLRLSTKSDSPLLAEGASLLSVIGSGPAAPAGSVLIHVDAPLIGDEDDSADSSDNENERPLSREELKAKTLRGLNKRKSRQNTREPGGAGAGLKTAAASMPSFNGKSPAAAPASPDRGAGGQRRSFA